MSYSSGGCGSDFSYMSLARGPGVPFFQCCLAPACFLQLLLWPPVDSVKPLINLPLPKTVKQGFCCRHLRTLTKTRCCVQRRQLWMVEGNKWGQGSGTMRSKRQWVSQVGGIWLQVTIPPNGVLGNEDISLSHVTRRPDMAAPRLVQGNDVRRFLFLTHCRPAVCCWLTSLACGPVVTSWQPQPCLSLNYWRGVKKGMM